MVTLVAFSIPVLTALIVGFRAGRVRPETRAEFGQEVAWGVGWCLAVAYLWHAIWGSAAVPGTFYQIATFAMWWTVLTLPIWAPVFVITYLGRIFWTHRHDGR